MKFSLSAATALAWLATAPTQGASQTATATTTAGTTATASATAGTTWDVVADAQLPKPVSDHSSTFVPGDASKGTTPGIYIAGGCDSPNGNTYVDADGLELDFFLCSSISNELHIFDADAMTFRTSTALLPRARYRHAAVHAQGKLWLIGGRTVPEDNVISEVDVYDPATDSWTTVGKIPEDFLTSDNGAFVNADGSTIYVVGGYNPFYYSPDALATTFSFDTQAALASSNSNLVVEDLVVTQRADLSTGRGDIHAVSSEDGTKAYVAGGYAGMCQPLTSAEVYDLESDTWSSAGDLLQARGDGAIVEAAGTIFVIGGEVNHPDQCAAPELVPPLSHQSQAVNDVEAFQYNEVSVTLDLDAAASSTSTSKWVDVADIPEFRFRFSAASWPATGVAYAFGGQTTFDESCKCYPTTTEITAIDSSILLTKLLGATSDGVVTVANDNTETATGTGTGTATAIPPAPPSIPSTSSNSQTEFDKDDDEYTDDPVSVNGNEGESESEDIPIVDIENDEEILFMSAAPASYGLSAGMVVAVAAAAVLG